MTDPTDADPPGTGVPPSEDDPQVLETTPSEDDPQVLEAPPLMGEEAVAVALRDHALGTARRTLDRLGGTLDANNLEQFLEEEGYLRYPTELRFDGKGLESHQFAQPAFRGTGKKRRCALHIRPRYEALPETHPYIVAYMAGAINYGAAATGDLCELLGAALLGMSVDEFYGKVCDIADL